MILIVIRNVLKRMYGNLRCETFPSCGRGPDLP